MSKVQIIILIVLAVGMVAISMLLGNWAEQLNPDGIAAHPEAPVDSTATTAESTEQSAEQSAEQTAESSNVNADSATAGATEQITDATPSGSQTTDTPRDAFSFGVSMGLLASGLLYCCIAFGLLISARSKGQGANPFIYWVAGLAGLGFVLSYLIDDYFY